MKPGPGKCVHCLGKFQKRNWDHVFPKSWYPDTTPNNIEKWKIPTCKLCNDAYGKLEDDLLQRLGLCIDPDAQASSGITRKALRALDPAYAKGQKDKRLRKARREKLLREVRSGEDVSTENIYPGFEEKWGRPANEQRAIPLPAKSLRKLAEKITRGIFYIEDKKYIEHPYKIEFYALRDSDTEPVVELLEKHGKMYARGPGIVVQRVVAPEDGISSIFGITVWDQFRMYVSVMKEDE
ncbi:MAG: hypothetical protein EPN55_10055 [Gammaproteobacteria bacterium]|nr:MAG: hypothetical protein EPN55_10055 [Gammaproteobacteria bacterium]